MAQPGDPLSARAPRDANGNNRLRPVRPETGIKNRRANGRSTRAAGRPPVMAGRGRAGRTYANACASRGLTWVGLHTHPGAKHV